MAHFHHILAAVEVNGNEVLLVKEYRDYFIYWGEAKQNSRTKMEIITNSGKRPTLKRVLKEFLAATDAAQYLKFEKL